MAGDDPKMRESGNKGPLLAIRDLKTHFFTDDGVARAVDGVDLEIRSGETLGLVGESGCGKSVTALSIMRLVPDPPGRIVGGEIRFGGQDICKLPGERMREIRGNRIGMIFQEPMTSLNPVFTVGNQIMEAIILHQKVKRREAREKAIGLLRKVGIPSPEVRIDEYPHQLSGGMRQRVMIAMALSCGPDLLIADEPTTALDVTIQAQILDLMGSLQEELRMSVLLITHDLGIVAQMAHRVVVMYGGKVAEEAGVEDLFLNPRHPYTVGLFRSMPRMGGRKARLDVIPGVVPSAIEFPTACRFHPRCPFMIARCREEEPALVDVGPGHRAACHRWEEVSPTAWEQVARREDAGT